MSVTEKQSEEAGAVERVAHAAREVQSAPKALGGRFNAVSRGIEKTVDLRIYAEIADG